ncbi:MAG: 2'-5' RNA ligase family protein, partial [Candidatus Eisenbacteria bacterium]
MRVFIAVFPPADTQRIAERATQPLKGVRDAVSWVRPENLHYTMRFLGEQDDAAVERARLAMTKAAASQPRFGASLGGFGAFPTAKKAR